MDAADLALAKKLVLGPMLLYVLWLLATNLFSFGVQLKQQHEQQQRALQTIEQNGQRQAEILRQNSENLARQRLQAATPPTAAREKRASGQKMPASVVVKRLRRVNAFGVVATPERLLHCTDNNGAWDYTCVFHGDPIKSATWVQFGVLVDQSHIIEMSETYPASTPLPPPLSLTTR
jgi:hypothetical protein